MNDEEMHNLFPVIYAKQMSKGFEDHTKRRSMVYSAGGYSGIQQYVATWAGDTGGGAKPLASMLNLGFSGHSNHSCDMNARDPESIHFGFLQTWAQQNNWDYWYQPWLLDDDMVSCATSCCLTSTRQQPKRLKLVIRSCGPCRWSAPMIRPGTAAKPNTCWAIFCWSRYLQKASVCLPVPGLTSGAVSR
jgi:hypothetical protein